MKKKLKKLEKRVDLLESIINATQDKVVIVKEDKVVETKPAFKPVFMKCTQEQFDRMRPKLESVGCRIFYVDIHDDRILTNNYRNTNNTIATVGEKNSKIHNRTEVHTEDEFLEACGYIEKTTVETALTAFEEACKEVEETIEYTLENIQVDCRGLSEEQIYNMCLVFENAGYKKFNLENFEIEKSEEDFVYLRKYKTNNDFALLLSEFTTITYEKFIEFFSEKLIEELHAEHKEAKREPKVGDVVKAWNDDKDEFVYGVYVRALKGKCNTNKPYNVGSSWFENIELVTEININDFKREEN